MSEANAVEAGKKRAAVTFNLASWDGDWETAAVEAHNYIAALEARNAELEERWDQLQADDHAILQHATVYDYNRHGVVAFQQDGLDTAKFKALAETRQECVVFVFLTPAAAVALAQQQAPATGSETAGEANTEGNNER